MKHEYVDPVTGDKLTCGERASWIVQGIIRRWLFLIVLMIITAVAWATNNSIVLLWWNLCASFMAILIESVVGMAMFNQTRRDAVKLRETRALTLEVRSLTIDLRTLLQILSRTVAEEAKDIESIEEKLGDE